MRKLISDSQGSVAIEFALLTTNLFFVFLAVFDFAGLLLQEHRLGQAISAATNDSFQNRTTVSFTNIPTYIQNASGNASTTVSVTCNGTIATCVNTSRACACVSATGSYTAATCGATCSGSGYSAGQTAGYFMSINASQTYSGLIVPTGLLRNGSVSRIVTIRLQ